MNWDAIGAIGEIVGALAVVVTLIYLAIQIRSSNKHSELESFRHNGDGLNQLCDMFSHSPERASIVNRGRESLANLTEDERMVFQHMHLRVLNTIESWHYQVTSTSPPGAYRDEQILNLADLVESYVDYPGTREIWSEVRHTFVPIQELVESRISDDS